MEWRSVMSDITLSIPDETLVALKVKPEQLGSEIRLAAAVKLYELRRISSGAAAKLAGIPRTLFLTKLADYGVDTFNLTEQELQQERRLA
jgi:predicted HTH domain antitoxin